MIQNPSSDSDMLAKQRRGVWMTILSIFAVIALFMGLFKLGNHFCHVTQRDHKG